MTIVRTMDRFWQTGVVLAFAIGTAFGPIVAVAQDRAPAVQQADPELVIENDSALPDTYPHGRYEVRFMARGGVTPVHWRVTLGSLPPGMRLEDNGLLHGEAERAGDFQFTVSATGSGVPQLAAHKSFVIRVRAAFTMEWKTKAHVDGNRIEGSAEVTNTTPDDLDLTFIVLAVAENGRATAIGYQHFVLPRATVNKVLPFGDTLPRGRYEAHVDAVGEVEAKKLIYRQRLVSPGLEVTAGP